MLANLMEIFSLKYIREYLSRNRELIIISFALFVLSVIVGAVISDSIRQYVLEIFRILANSIPKNATTFDQAIYLFTNNIRANIVIMLGGLIFSIISVFAIILNGLIVGFTATITKPAVFLVGIIPHGIFEIPAMILSLVGAFLITKMEINIIRSILDGRLKDEIIKSEQTIKDILLSFVMVLVLLVVAAFIEAYITPVLLHMVI